MRVFRNGEILQDYLREMAEELTAESQRLNGVIEGAQLRDKNLIDTMRSSIAAAMKEQPRIMSANFPPQVGKDGVYRIGQTDGSSISYDYLEDMDSRVGEIESELARMNARHTTLSDLLNTLDDLLHRHRTNEHNSNEICGAEYEIECDGMVASTLVCTLTKFHDNEHAFHWHDGESA